MKIELSNLEKHLGTNTAVDIESFTINNGDILGLVGNNGAGKTTLFRLMLDLLKADEGVVTMHPSADGVELVPSSLKLSPDGGVGGGYSELHLRTLTSAYPVLLCLLDAVAPVDGVQTVEQALRVG